MENCPVNVAITVDRTSNGKEHFEVLDGFAVDRPGHDGQGRHALDLVSNPLVLFRCRSPVGLRLLRFRTTVAVRSTPGDPGKKGENYEKTF